MNWTWSIDVLGRSITLYGPAPELVLDEAGTFNVTLNVTDADGNWDIDTVTVEVLDTEPPVAFVDDILANMHDLVTLDGTSCTDNVGVVNYTWTFNHAGRPITRYGAMVNFTFELAGTYTVKLTVRDARLNMAEDSFFVFIRDTEPPTAVAGEDMTIDQHMALGFDEAGSTDNVGVVNWRWRFEYRGQTVELNRSFPSFRFDDAGEYGMLLTVWDAEGNFASDTLVLTVLDVEPPIADAGRDARIEQHDRTVLDAGGSTDNVGIVNYTWVFTYDGEQVVLHGRVDAFRFDIAGRYPVVLFVMDAAGLTDSDEVVIEVVDMTPPRAVAGWQVVSVDRLTVLLDGHASWDDVEVVEWTWTLQADSGDITLHGEAVDHRFNASGDYPVTLVVRDGAGNVNTTSIIVTIPGDAGAGSHRMPLWVAATMVILAGALLTLIMAIRPARRRRPGRPARARGPEAPIRALPKGKA